MSSRLLLASASPRRRQLLTEYGYHFAVEPAVVIEVAPEHLTPAETVLYNARLKADYVSLRHPDELVLGVDTLVACGGRIYGKPADMDEALAMLQQLAGRVHEVFTGVWLMRRSGGSARGLVEVTRVALRDLSGEQLRPYLERIGPLDKAGAYAAQDDQGELIERVEGSLTNVIGLPMEALARLLAKENALPEA